MFLQNVRTGQLYLGVSSILPYKVFGKRLVKNSRILRYTKARLQGTHPLKSFRILGLKKQEIPAFSQWIRAISFKFQVFTRVNYHYKQMLYCSK